MTAVIHDANAAAAAQMLLEEGETVESFFAQDSDAFAADVEPWLATAGGSTTLTDYDDAVAHFVNYLETEYGTLLTNAINVELSNFEARKSAGREDVDYS